MRYFFDGEPINSEEDIPEDLRDKLLVVTLDENKYFLSKEYIDAATNSWPTASNPVTNNPNATFICLDHPNVEYKSLIAFTQENRQLNHYIARYKAENQKYSFKVLASTEPVKKFGKIIDPYKYLQRLDKSLNILNDFIQET